VRVVLAFHESTPVPVERILALVEGEPERFELIGASKPGDVTTRVGVRFGSDEAEWPFRFLHWVFRRLETDPPPRKPKPSKRAATIAPRPPSLGPARRAPRRRIVRTKKRR